MKKVLLLVFLISYSFSTDYVNITLVEFVQKVANATNKNIIISDTVKKDFHIFLPDYSFTKNKSMSIDLLSNILEVNDLSLKFLDNVVLIYKKKIVIPPAVEEKEVKEVSKIFKYQYLEELDIRNYLTLYPEIKFSILKGRILITALPDVYELIHKQLQILDESYLQKKINVSIISTNNSKLKDIGIDMDISLQKDNSFLKLITSNADFTTTLIDPLKFYAFINLMKQKGFTKLITNPSITLVDKKPAIIESTTNIPYLVSNTSTTENTTTTQNSYEYKDIGLKAYFENVVIFPHQISFDLDIYIQSIIEKSITPITSSKHIKTHISLENNSTVLIGGLNSNEAYEIVKSLPMIEYIPILNQLTSHTTKEDKSETFTIIISNN